MKRLGLLLVAALAALMAVAPIASAHHGRARGRLVCGQVTAQTSASALGLFIGPRTLLIANPNHVATANAVTGAEACARVRRARGTKGWVLVAFKVQPTAVVVAVGPITMSSGSIRVATITFQLGAKTLPPTIASGDTIAVLGTVATPGAPLLVKRIRELKVRRPAHHGGKKAFKTRADILGNVTGYTPATATTAGSLQVAGITVALPPHKMLRKRLAVGARVVVRAVLSGSTLSAKRLVVVRRAPAAA